VAYAQNIISS